MPTYDYRCNGCGHAFEHFQSMSEPLLRKCPECGKQKLERLIGAGAGFLFKGAGFYITDYRSDSYQAAAKKESGGSGEKAAGDKPASDKPASATAGGEKSGEKPASPTSDKGGEKTAAPAPTSAKPSKPAQTKGKSSKSR